MTRSTPKSSDSGNIMPASMTMMSSPSCSTSMFMPNSPSPPRGMAVSGCGALLGVLLKETLAPQSKRASYHTAEIREWPSGPGIGHKKDLPEPNGENRQRKGERSKRGLRRRVSLRSEERRVGKESGDGGGWEQERR